MLLAGIINKQVSDLCLQQQQQHHQLHGHNKFLTQNRSTPNKQQQLMICCCSSRNVMMRAQACNTKSKNKEWVLAIDVGTGGTKAALITSQGCVSTSAFSAHPPPSPSCLSAGTASAEQEMERWWDATVEVVKTCMAMAAVNHSGTVRALTVTGQMQNVILLPQIARLAGGADYLVSVSGSHQGATSVLAKLRWLDKHDSNAAQHCQTLLLGGHDYVVWKLCGVCVTDSTTASTTGLTDLSFKYATGLMHDVGLGHWIDKLPLIHPPNIPCGEVSAWAAEELGNVSLQGIPVVHCCGDAGACTLGAGAGVLGNLYAYLGTSGWVAGSFQHSAGLPPKAKPMPRPSGVFTLGHPESSLVFKTGSIMTAGGNLAWAASTGYPGSVSMKQIDSLVKLERAGCGGLLYLPYLNGERCPFEDGNARACFIGISASTTREQMLRAVMEGVAFALRSSCDALAGGELHDSDTRCAPLRLVGGGARSPVWPSIMAGVFGQTVEVLMDPQEVGVKGAAILAGQWLGWHSTLFPGGNWVQQERTYDPSPNDVKIYDEMYPIYTKVYDGLRDTFHDLSAFQRPSL
ncbi:hypothetical protein BDL97_02G130800 [Sphagnum fallax]|nr:hypothetical protein BDL97_02G130800 [Sphagnum fallax]